MMMVLVEKEKWKETEANGRVQGKGRGKEGGELRSRFRPHPAKSARTGSRKETARKVGCEVGYGCLWFSRCWKAFAGSVDNTKLHRSCLFGS